MKVNFIIFYRIYLKIESNRWIRIKSNENDCYVYPG